MADCGGHTILCHRDHGHRLVKGRRKVVLWSAKPWRTIDSIGDDALPPGRFVSGVTTTTMGEITVVGVCIPWSGSRTNKFGGTQRQWQDHEEYLDVLTRTLPRGVTSNLVVLGDFNQAIGQRSNVPMRLRDKLQDAFSGPFDIPTASLSHDGKPCIDHVALGSGLSVESLDAISNIDPAGKRLSDHFGIIAAITTQTPLVPDHPVEQRL